MTPVPTPGSRMSSARVPLFSCDSEQIRYRAGSNCHLRSAATRCASAATGPSPPSLLSAHQSVAAGCSGHRERGGERCACQERWWRSMARLPARERAELLPFPSHFLPDPVLLCSNIDSSSLSSILSLLVSAILFTFDIQKEVSPEQTAQAQAEERMTACCII